MHLLFSSSKKCIAKKHQKFLVDHCPGLEDSVDREKSLSQKWRVKIPSPPLYYNLEIKGFSGKGVGLGITVLY